MSLNTEKKNIRLRWLATFMLNSAAFFCPDKTKKLQINHNLKKGANIRINWLSGNFFLSEFHTKSNSVAFFCPDKTKNCKSTNLKKRGQQKNLNSQILPKNLVT